MSKTAVVLLNLGGPDSLSAVPGFLFRLFNDRAILPLPQPFRAALAKWIVWKRRKKATAIYQKLGGKSPILEYTQRQARALEARLKSQGDYKVFVSMRYSHPNSKTVIRNIQAYQAEHVLLLPLYPQFSTTTTGSSFDDWDAHTDAMGLAVPTRKICCYPTQNSFVVAHAKLVREYYWKAAEFGTPRVLFSAHGVPERVIMAGDPYQYQIEKTAAAIVQILAMDDLDYTVCYQSKVGNATWIGPSTEEELARAASQSKPVVVVPLSFVSEHSETLVELDMDYREYAESLGIPSYQRVPALSDESFFIEALCEMVVGMKDSTGISSCNSERFCIRQFHACPCKG